MNRIPHHIVDGFLSSEAHSALLAHCLDVRDFAPGHVVLDGQRTYRPEVRRVQLSNDRLGTHLPGFDAALRTLFPAICQALGMKSFALASIEYSLAASGDGSYFKPHRDTLIGRDREFATRDRLISAVYYLHREPRMFEGGELQIFSMDSETRLQIEPRNNRLVVFPAFFMHEVLPVSVPGKMFTDSRFSISCWFDALRSPEAH